MNSYIADVWTITEPNINILFGTEYYCYVELGDYSGYNHWWISIKEGQTILKIMPGGYITPPCAYFSGFRVWFNRDPNIDPSAPFELILKPELEIDFYHDPIPLCNFCLGI